MFASMYIRRFRGFDGEDEIHVGDTGEIPALLHAKKMWKTIYHETGRLHVRVPTDKAGSLSNVRSNRI
jgi:hypothetical protein